MFFQTQEIQREYRRLDGICGLDTTYMPIKRYRQKGKTVAMCEFTSHSAIPVQFMFNLYYLDRLHRCYPARVRPCGGRAAFWPGIVERFRPRAAVAEGMRYGRLQAVSLYL